MTISTAVIGHQGHFRLSGVVIPGLESPAGIFQIHAYASFPVALRKDTPPPSPASGNPRVSPERQACETVPSRLSCAEAEGARRNTSNGTRASNHGGLEFEARQILFLQNLVSAPAGVFLPPRGGLRNSSHSTFEQTRRSSEDIFEFTRPQGSLTHAAVHCMTRARTILRRVQHGTRSRQGKRKDVEKPHIYHGQRQTARTGCCGSRTHHSVRTCRR